MIFILPESGEKIELVTVGKWKLPEGECEILSSRSTFMVPIILPSNVLRKLSHAQIQALAFDRIPVPPDAVRTWILSPNLNWFSRGTATAWVIAAPLARLKSADQCCVPADMLLAVLLFDKRFDRGGVLALDSPQNLSLIGMTSRRRSAVVWQHVFSPDARSPEIPAAFSAFLGKRSCLLHLDDGGSHKDALARMGSMVTEPSAIKFSDALKSALRSNHFQIHPDLVPRPPESPRRVTAFSPAFTQRWGMAARAAFALVALMLPFIALGIARERYMRVSGALARMMGDGYERRYGARVPDPIMALRAKARSVSESSRPSSVTLPDWLAVVSRLSDQAASASLRMDKVSLDGARVEIRGSSADLKSVAQWVANLSSDPDLMDAALVSSETRQSDKRTVFLLRARLRRAEKRA